MLTDALPLLLTETIYVIPETEKTTAPPVVVSIPDIPTPAPSKSEHPRNRNRLVVIYNNIKTVYLNPEEEALLAKILGAVKLRLEDVDLVNVNNHRDTLIEILRDKMANQIISFGIELRDLDIQVPLEAYRVQRVEGIDILLADSLFELQLNTDKKKMLWQALQGMFLLRR